MKKRASSGFNMSDPTCWDKGHNQMDTFKSEEAKGINKKTSSTVLHNEF